ncbi:MAG: hypothetical protein IT445_13435 [Phycisphaeraceae bacterium]|nr:hypothetical protein [Phycisphaeraceae bacterium]
MSDNNRWLVTLPQCRQKEMLAKHAAFWTREPGSAALLGYVTESSRFPLQNLDIQHEGAFTPQDITAEFLRADTSYREPILPEDELFPAKTPLAPIPWSEGYCGADIFLYTKSRTARAKSPGKPPESLEELQAMLQPAWLDKLVESTKANVSAAADKSLVCESILRGPGDCLESLIGAQTLCLWCYDKPELLMDMLDWLADCLIRLHKAQLAATPHFHGGTVNRYHVWGPEENIMTAADVAVLLSPTHFRDIFLPSYRKIARSFKTAGIHFHTAARQHATALMEMDELDAIEWGLDSMGPPLEELLPLFARILQNKSVILKNVINESQAEMIRKKLPNEGLCLIIRKNY